MARNSREDGVLDNYQAVVSAFSEFLTVAVHTILYERNIYPRTSFLSARKYNYPVRQNRHPKVCKWIQDAVAAVEVELLKVRASPSPPSIWSVALAAGGCSTRCVRCMLFCARDFQYQQDLALMILCIIRAEVFPLTDAL